MDDLLTEIETCVTSGHFYLGLFCTLSLPDICGALEAPDGLANGKRYIKWFDMNMPPEYSKIFTGSQCYAFRCSTLHQGRASHKMLGYSRIIFIARKSDTQPPMHLNELNDALNLDIRVFSRDVIQSVRNWLTKVAANSGVQANLEHFLRVHRGGLPGYVDGMDVLS